SFTTNKLGEYRFFAKDPNYNRDGNKVLEYKLAQNYPNPFNPVTTIKYQLKENTDVQLLIFNTLGQKVKTLVNAYQSANSYEVLWNGSNDNGRKVASGIYFYKLITANKVLTKKMVLIK
ncbi:MAG: T9SS type A sorting domain-containing protein, partial [Calditrichaeota bacterium]|nr:T9SS type A sorting domain-containing protein [Calditrichota bacterium]